VSRKPVTLGGIIVGASTAVYLLAAPTLAAVWQSWTPIWLGACLLCGAWVAGGVTDQVIKYRDERRHTTWLAAALNAAQGDAQNKVREFLAAYQQADPSKITIHQNPEK
jgi:hypothetical protein